MTDVAVLVPRRSDGGQRDRVWAWVRDRWQTEHPDWQLVEGHNHDEPFNCSAARNAARQGTHAEVLFLADADTFLDPAQAAEAVGAAARTGRITVAHDRFRYLGTRMSRRVLAGWTGDLMPGVAFTMECTVSCGVAIPSRLFDEVGGFDEGFVGWGGEDVAFHLAATAIGGGEERVPGDIWHLWHPTSPRDEETFQRRLSWYADVAGDPVRMRALLDQILHDPQAVPEGVAVDA